MATSQQATPATTSDAPNPMGAVIAAPTATPTRLMTCSCLRSRVNMCRLPFDEGYRKGAAVVAGE